MHEDTKKEPGPGRTKLILPKDIYNTEVPATPKPLDYEHFKVLNDSGLTEETIKLCGYYTTNSGWAMDFQHPYTGETELTITRLDNPKSGMPKYLQPENTKPFPYFSRQLDWTKILDDASQPIIITEGCKKADVAIQYGFPTVSLQGTYGWSHKKKLIKSMRLVLIPGRTIYICYDSDLKENDNVKKAVEDLAKEAYRRKCKVLQINLPRETKGIDDFFVNLSKEVKEDNLNE